MYVKVYYCCAGSATTLICGNTENRSKYEVSSK